jgi:hypothetical protein
MLMLMESEMGWMLLRIVGFSENQENWKLDVTVQFLSGQATCTHVQVRPGNMK